MASKATASLQDPAGRPLLPEVVVSVASNAHGSIAGTSPSRPPVCPIMCPWPSRPWPHCKTGDGLINAKWSLRPWSSRPRLHCRYPSHMQPDPAEPCPWPSRRTASLQGRGRSTKRPSPVVSVADKATGSIAGIRGTGTTSRAMRVSVAVKATAPLQVGAEAVEAGEEHRVRRQGCSSIAEISTGSTLLASTCIRAVNGTAPLQTAGGHRSVQGRVSMAGNATASLQVRESHRVGDRGVGVRGPVNAMAPSQGDGASAAVGDEPYPWFSRLHCSQRKAEINFCGACPCCLQHRGSIAVRPDPRMSPYRSSATKHPTHLVAVLVAFKGVQQRSPG